MFEGTLMGVIGCLLVSQFAGLFLEVGEVQSHAVAY